MDPDDTCALCERNPVFDGQVFCEPCREEIAAYEAVILEARKILHEAPQTP